MKCKDAKALIEEGIKSRDLENHLSRCSSCRAHAEFIGSMSLLRIAEVPMPTDEQWTQQRILMGKKRKPKRSGLLIPALATTAASILIVLFVVATGPKDLTPTPDMAYIMADEQDLYSVIEESGIPVELSGMDGEQVEEVEEILYENMNTDELIASLDGDELDEFLDYMEKNMRSRT